MLDDTSNELYPDMMGLEVDYVQKYVNSDWVLPVADIGITADDYSKQYQYNIDLGTDWDGNIKALFWQATPGCIQVRADLAATIMEFITCDTEGMIAINAMNSDYVNNTDAIASIIESGASADGNGFLYPDAGQNFMEFFLPLADGLDASIVTAEDQQILSLLDTQTKAYATGEKDLDTALADLTATIHDTFSYLSVE